VSESVVSSEKIAPSGLWLGAHVRGRAGQVLLSATALLVLVDLGRPLSPGRPTWLRAGMALGIAAGIMSAALLSSHRRRRAADPLMLYVFLALAIDGVAQAVAPAGWPLWPFMALLVACVCVAEPAVVALGVAALAATLEIAQSAAGGFAVWKPAAVAVIGYGLLVFAVHRALASEKDRLSATLAELARLRHGIGDLDEAENSVVRNSGPLATLRNVSEEERRARQSDRVAELDAYLERLVKVARLSLAAHSVLVFAIDREKETAYLRASDGPDLIRREVVVPLTADPIAFVVERAQSFYATDFKRILWALPYYGPEVKIGTLIAVPISTGGAVTAVLVADQLEVQAFTKAEPKLLEDFAEMAAEAFARARAAAFREELGTEFKAAYDVSRQLASMGEVESVCRALLSSSRQMVPLEGGAVVLSDEARTRYTLQEAFGWAEEFKEREVGLTEKTWAAWALRSAEDHYLLNDLGDKERLPVLVLDEGTRRDESLLVLPLKEEKGALGALVLTAGRGVLNAKTQRVLGILANQAAALLARIQLTERIKEKAMSDPLTGLRNRRAFAEELAESLAREERHDGHLALVMIDLDHFKKLNDTHGHPAGDAALRATAHVLRKLLRRGDVAARYGGEEFVVMLPGASEAGALRFAERIRAALEEAETDYAGVKLRVTASLGLAVWPADAPDADALLTAADRALYVAKASGRNRVVRASPQPSAAAEV
jgi:diguanylate cyclase (GGDEF)-like protein